MKKLFTFITLNMAVFSAFSQASWSTIGSNFATNSINPKIIVCNDTAFVAYVNPSTNQVELKKNVGASWALVGSYTTLDNQFDLDVNQDGFPILSTILRSNNLDNSAYEFFLIMRNYENGVVTEIENEYIGFGPMTTNTVDVFDVAMSRWGGYGCVFRFNASYECIYMYKAQNDSWWSTLYTAPGDMSGVKDSKLAYTSSGAMIYSRNQSAFGGTVDALVKHTYAHSSTSSQAVATYAPAIYSPIIYSKINLTENADTVFICVEETNGNATIYNQKFDSNGITSLSTSLSVPDAFSIQLQVGDDFVKYLSVIEQSGALFLANLYRFNASFTFPSLLGNTTINDVGNMVGEYNFFLHNGFEPYVAFQYGPPFNNTKARKYTCSEAPTYSYNSTTNEISTTATITGSPSYQWYDCSSVLDCIEIPGATGATFSPTTSGVYSVAITNGDCNTSGNFVTVTLASIEENQNDVITLYPNPSNSIVTIGNLQVGSVVKIKNALGQIIHTENSNTSHLTVNVQNMQNGIYFVTIEQNGFLVGTKKLIVE